MKITFQAFGRRDMVNVDLTPIEVDHLQQALAYWCSNHPAYLGPTSQALLEEGNQMRELHKQFTELRLALAKGGE